MYIFIMLMQQANVTLQNRIKHPDEAIMRHRVPTHSRTRTFPKERPEHSNGNRYRRNRGRNKWSERAPYMYYFNCALNGKERP